MILVGRYRSPFTRRVAVYLRLLDIPFEHRPTSVWDSGWDEVRKLNPLGRVPVLILDDGEVVHESTAILDYLDEAAGPEKALTPPGGAARRRVLGLTALALGTCEKVVAVNYEAERRPPEYVYVGWIERCAGQAAAGLAALDAAGATPWLTGDRLTRADVTAGVMIDHARLTRPDLVPPGRYPNLDALAARYGDLPAFAETRPDS
jgi:glutathione S-transferase